MIVVRIDRRYNLITLAKWTCKYGNYRQQTQRTYTFKRAVHAKKKDSRRQYLSSDII